MPTRFTTSFAVPSRELERARREASRVRVPIRPEVDLAQGDEGLSKDPIQGTGVVKLNNESKAPSATNDCFSH